MFDDGIIERWRVEAVKFNDNDTKFGDRIPFHAEMTNQMFEYSIQELRYRAERHATSLHGAVYVLPGDVYKSDSAIPEELRIALQGAVGLLEGVPEDQKDWHPGSDGKVLDLMHPSLFPLIYGTSRILPIGSKALSLDDCIDRIGEGEVLPKCDDHTRSSYSEKFQWLPCDVDIAGEKPK